MSVASEDEKIRIVSEKKTELADHIKDSGHEKRKLNDLCEEDIREGIRRVGTKLTTPKMMTQPHEVETDERNSKMPNYSQDILA